MSDGLFCMHVLLRWSFPVLTAKADAVIVFHTIFHDRKAQCNSL